MFVALTVECARAEQLRTVATRRDQTQVWAGLKRPGRYGYLPVCPVPGHASWEKDLHTTGTSILGGCFSLERPPLRGVAQRPEHAVVKAETGGSHNREQSRLLPMARRGFESHPPTMDDTQWKIAVFGMQMAFAAGFALAVVLFKVVGCF